MTVLAFAQFDMELLSASVPAAAANAESAGFLELIESSFAGASAPDKALPPETGPEEKAVAANGGKRPLRPKELFSRTPASETASGKPIVFPPEYFYPLVPAPASEVWAAERPARETPPDEVAARLEGKVSLPLPIEEPSAELQTAPLIEDDGACEAAARAPEEGVRGRRKILKEDVEDAPRSAGETHVSRVEDGSYEAEAAPAARELPNERIQTAAPLPRPERTPGIAPLVRPSAKLDVARAAVPPMPERSLQSLPQEKERAEVGNERPSPSRTLFRPEQKQNVAEAVHSPVRPDAEIAFPPPAPPPPAAPEPRVERLHASVTAVPVKEAPVAPPSPSVKIQIPLEDGREVRAEIVATPAALHVKMQAPDTALQAEIGRHAPELRSRLEEIQRESPAASAASWEPSQTEAVMAVEGVRFDGVATGEGEGGMRSRVPFDPALDQEQSRDGRRRPRREFLQEDDENQ